MTYIDPPYIDSYIDPLNQEQKNHINLNFLKYGSISCLGYDMGMWAHGPGPRARGGAPGPACPPGRGRLPGPGAQAHGPILAQALLSISPIRYIPY